MTCCDDGKSTIPLVEELDDTNTILRRFRQCPAPADFEQRLISALADEAQRRGAAESG